MTLGYRKRTQDSIWYNFLPIMEKNNIKVSREWVKQLIRKICDKWGITRESIGIIAGARATMYFDGEWSSVKFDDINDLALKGTDILVIEKMDIVEVLSEHAKKYGVAIVNTSGYFTEYGIGLMEAAESEGGHVAILTDYDDHGLQIASKATNVVRIGIDEETLQYFGLSRDKLSISGQRHLKDFSFLDEYDDSIVDKEFVKYRRVEIDAVLAQVGGERLWEYIMHKLTELFPTRDYNRAISMPAVETLYDKTIQNFMFLINKHVSNKLEPEMEEIMEGLEDVEGMIDVDEEKEKIDERLEKALIGDKDYETIIKTVDELIRSTALSKIPV